MSKIQNERLKMYLEAEKAVLTGQSYTIGNRTLTRASLATIQAAINDLVAAGATVDDELLDPAGSTKRVVLMD
nr:MAG TPA_asm: head to tail adaptor [Caudoviricetes sp.]